jgi:hypothetical protein
VLSSISFSIASGWSLLGEAHGDALARQHVREQRVGGAVELRHGDDVAAQLGDVEHGVVQRRLAAGDAERFHAAFEGGDAAFQHGGGRILMRV